MRLCAFSLTGLAPQVLLDLSGSRMSFNEKINTVHGAASDR